MPQPLLSGEQEYVDDPIDPLVRQLENRVRELERKLERAELDARHAKEDVGQTLTKLKSMTLPFLNLLKAIHGEIDGLGIESVPANSGSTTPQNAGRWQPLMTKLGGLKAQFIQALLDFGPSTVTAIRAATGMSKQSVYNTANDLSKLGLITRNGSQYALKD